MDTKSSILIIDDEEGIRRGCTRVLRSLGHEIETAATYHEGLQKIGSRKYDLVLLDIMMPDGRGIDLLEPIHDQDPETVAILITGYATVEMAVDAIKRGAYDFISKPFTAQLLTMTVAQGLEKRRLSLDARRLQAAEQQIAELQLAREQAEKLSEFKSAFATMVAHELRAPVGAAQTLVRTLVRGHAGALAPQQAELLGRVETRLDGLLKLVNDLLTLAASKSLAADKPLQPVSIPAVLERVVAAFEDEAAGKHVALERGTPAGDTVIDATPDGLETILGNLVGNAIKYTPAGGCVRLEILQREGCARLSVADSGIGMSEEDVKRLGEEFFRAGNARERGIPGTGLGLSIVKELLTRFGGSMDVQSRLGAGTTITLSFPLMTRTEIA